MAIAVGKIKENLMERIDQEDIFEVEKVERYCSLIMIARRLERDIKKNGEIVETVNASQTFLKANPALTELKNINAQINATGKTINFKKKDKKAQLVPIEKNIKKVSLI